MPAIEEGNNLGDLLKYEASHFYSREAATVAANQTLSLGAIVARDPQTWELVPINVTATDGTEVAAGVLAADVDTSDGNSAKGLLIARHAIVAVEAIVWPDGYSDLEKSLAVKSLGDIGVAVRSEAGEPDLPAPVIPQAPPS